MIATVTNLQSTAIEKGGLPFPFNQAALDANGGGNDSVALGVNEHDLLYGEDFGDPAWKRLNLLVQEGKISVSFAAASGSSFDTLEDLSTT